MPHVRRRALILLLAARRTPARSWRARRSLRDDRAVAAATNRWRPIAALAAIVLFGSLLAWGAAARILVCWWEYPGRMCTIIKPAKSATRQWAGNGYRRAPPPCPRGFWAVCGECPC